MEQFPERLTAARKALRMQQIELARATGIPQGSISRLEHGRHEPTVATLCRLADALDVTTDYLLGRLARVGRSDRLSSAIERLGAALDGVRVTITPADGASDDDQADAG